MDHFASKYPQKGNGMTTGTNDVHKRTICNNNLDINEIMSYKLTSIYVLIHRYNTSSCGFFLCWHFYWHNFPQKYFHVLEHQKNPCNYPL